jgi:hypothetical protein
MSCIPETARGAHRAPVAQMDRATASGAVGREFDPHRARHSFQRFSLSLHVSRLHTPCTEFPRHRGRLLTREVRPYPVSKRCHQPDTPQASPLRVAPGACGWWEILTWPRIIFSAASSSARFASVSIPHAEAPERYGAREQAYHSRRNSRLVFSLAFCLPAYKSRE